MWGYLVVGVLIGMLILIFIYCIWSFVDDCKTTSNMVDRLEYRADNLRADITSLRTSVRQLKKEVNELRVQNTPHNEEDRQEKGE